MRKACSTIWNGLQAGQPQTSPPQSMENFIRGGAVVTLAGTNGGAGTLVIQVSSQPAIAADQQFAPVGLPTRWAILTTTTLTGDGSTPFNLWADSYRWIQFVWTPTTAIAGTVTLDLNLSGYD